MAFSPAPTLPRAVANRIPSIPPEPSLFFAPLPSFGQRSTPVVRLMGSSWGSKPTFRASLWPYRQKLYSPKIGKQNRKQKQKPEQRPEHSGGSNLKSTISQKSTVASRLRQAVSAGQGMELVASPTVSSRSSRTSSPPPQRRADQMHTQPATSPRLPLSRFTTTTRYYQVPSILCPPSVLMELLILDNSSENILWGLGTPCMLLAVTCNCKCNCNCNCTCADMCRRRRSRMRTLAAGAAKCSAFWPIFAG